MFIRAFHIIKESRAPKPQGEERAELMFVNYLNPHLVFPTRHSRAVSSKIETNTYTWARADWRR